MLSLHDAHLETIFFPGKYSLLTILWTSSHRLICLTHVILPPAAPYPVRPSPKPLLTSTHFPALLLQLLLLPLLLPLLLLLLLQLLLPLLLLPPISPTEGDEYTKLGLAVIVLILEGLHAVCYR